jgi:hypothetical protein
MPADSKALLGAVSHGIIRKQPPKGVYQANGLSAVELAYLD